MSKFGPMNEWTRDAVKNLHHSNLYNKDTFLKQDFDAPDEDNGGYKVYTRVFFFALAVLFVGLTVINYNYLGGIEGIIAEEMLTIKKFEEYWTSLGCLVVFPVMAVVCLVMAFKRKK